MPVMTDCFTYLSHLKMIISSLKKMILNYEVPYNSTFSLIHLVRTCRNNSALSILRDIMLYSTKLFSPKLQIRGCFQMITEIYEVYILSYKGWLEKFSFKCSFYITVIKDSKRLRIKQWNHISKSKYAPRCKCITKWRCINTKGYISSPYIASGGN